MYKHPKNTPGSDKNLVLESAQSGSGWFCLVWKLLVMRILLLLLQATATRPLARAQWGTLARCLLRAEPHKPLRLRAGSSRIMLAPAAPNQGRWTHLRAGRRAASPTCKSGSSMQLPPRTRKAQTRLSSRCKASPFKRLYLSSNSRQSMKGFEARCGPDLVTNWIWHWRPSSSGSNGPGTCPVILEHGSVWDIHNQDHDHARLSDVHQKDCEVCKQSPGLEAQRNHWNHSDLFSSGLCWTPPGRYAEASCSQHCEYTKYNISLIKGATSNALSLNQSWLLTDTEPIGQVSIINIRIVRWLHPSIDLRQQVRQREKSKHPKFKCPPWSQPSSKTA